VAGDRATHRDATHREVVRRAFTAQAPAYAANPQIADPARVERLVRAVDPAPAARVLEVATGPGYVALGFGAVCREVVGLDLTEAPLALAERERHARGLENVRFQVGDAGRLPFADGELDVVVCRFAFHHFEDPPRVLAEMARVCRVGGKVAVEDLIVSERPARAAYQNRFEHLRDRSHTRAYALSTLLRRFAGAGLEVEHVSTDRLTPEVERWLANAQTPLGRAARARALIERDAEEDLSGAAPWREGGALRFIQRTATVVGRRLRGA
jgi:ubiquinone/menaquinone biosynthesis C-methylase UbiE